jgi:hypothetical protein
MDPTDPVQLTHFFASVGVPGILIAFAFFAASRRLSGITTLLVAVTAMHFGFVAFWRTALAAITDYTPVIGAATVSTFAQPSLFLAASCARVWLGFANYCPAAHQQMTAALRWIIGGTA